MSIFAGFDGGGTKTLCVLCDENGRFLGSGLGGPSNHIYCGKEAAAQSVRDAVSNAFADAGMEPCRFKAAYMASAAILLQHGDAHVPFFSTCIDAETLICESDIFPIWYGSVREEPAVVTIAGTGAVTYVCSREEFIRVSGWGPLLGDEGSGYSLALSALRLACRMYDGREERDEAFISSIFEHYDVTAPGQLLLKLNRGDTRSLVASCAKTVFELNAAGNGTASKLLGLCADEIALAVTTVIDKDPSGRSYPLILSGSLVGRNTALIPLLEERLIKQGSRVSRLCWLESHPAAVSAALALHSQGLDDAAEALLTATGGLL